MSKIKGMVIASSLGAIGVGAFWHWAAHRGSPDTPHHNETERGGSGQAGVTEDWMDPAADPAGVVSGSPTAPGKAGVSAQATDASVPTSGAQASDPAASGSGNTGSDAVGTNQKTPQPVDKATAAKMAADRARAKLAALDRRDAPSAFRDAIRDNARDRQACKSGDQAACERVAHDKTRHKSRQALGRIKDQLAKSCAKGLLDACLKRGDLDARDNARAAAEWYGLARDLAHETVLRCSSARGTSGGQDSKDCRKAKITMQQVERRSKTASTGH